MSALAVWIRESAAVVRSFGRARRTAGRWSSRLSFEVDSQEEPLMLFLVKWSALRRRALLEK